MSGGGEAHVQNSDPRADLQARRRQGSTGVGSGGLEERKKDADGTRRSRDSQRTPEGMRAVRGDSSKRGSAPSSQQMIADNKSIKTFAEW